MLTHKVEQLACVQGANPREFELKVNTILSEHSHARVELDRNVPFTAYIFYTDYVSVPETLADKYELNGRGATCAQCKHLETTNDKRRKIFPCKNARYGRVSLDAPACDIYYMEAEIEETRSYRNRRSCQNKSANNRPNRSTAI